MAGDFQRLPHISKKPLLQLLHLGSLVSWVLERQLWIETERNKVSLIKPPPLFCMLLGNHSRSPGSKIFQNFPVSIVITWSQWWRTDSLFIHCCPHLSIIVKKERRTDAFAYWTSFLWHHKRLWFPFQQQIPPFSSTISPLVPLHKRNKGASTWDANRLYKRSQGFLGRRFSSCSDAAFTNSSATFLSYLCCCWQPCCWFDSLRWSEW